MSFSPSIYPDGDSQFLCSPLIRDPDVMIIAYSNQLVQCIAKVDLPFNEQHFWSCVIQVLTALFTAGMVLGLIGPCQGHCGRGGG